jgi:hypothetical protein
MQRLILWPEKFKSIQQHSGVADTGQMLQIATAELVARQHYFCYGFLDAAADGLIRNRHPVGP